MATPIIPDATVPEFVLGRAHLRGDKRAPVDASTGRQLTYAELAVAVRAAGAWLAASGVRAGDVLALCAPNSIEFVLTWYAASSIGAVVTTVNPISADREIAGQLRLSQAHWLVTTAELALGKLQKAARTAEVVETFIVGPGAEAAPFASRLDWRYLGGMAKAPVVEASQFDVASLAPSSGTTGLPKLAVLTHRSLVAGVCQIGFAEPVDEDDLVVAALPLFHIFAQQTTMHPALRQGATLVILPRFDPGAFLRAIADYGVTRGYVATAARAAATPVLLQHAS